MTRGSAVQTCNRSGCTRAALYEVGFTVYAAGYGAHNSSPIRAVVGLYVCEQHRAVTSTGEVIGESMREAIDGATQAVGRQAANWASASLFFTPLGTPV